MPKLACIVSILAALACASISGQAGAKPCPVTSSLGIGPVVVGSALPIAGIVRVGQIIEPTEGEAEIFEEIALECGARVLVGIEGAVVARIIVKDRRASDNAGISVGTTFRDAIAKLTEVEVLSGEEEGGYLTIRARGVLYSFSTEGLLQGALADLKSSKADLSNQRLDAILVLP